MPFSPLCHSEDQRTVYFIAGLISFNLPLESFGDLIFLFIFLSLEVSTPSRTFFIVHFSRL